MKSFNLNRQTSISLCCSSLLLLNSVAKAQTESGSEQGPESTLPAQTEEIIIHGVRQSLSSAIEEKRLSDDIRDVITTEDVGTFPDQNLAEAVQRLPGVAITRDRGEGQFVTVRGLPPELNRISWNGITMPSSGNDRAVPLDIFSADLFGELAVVKSLSADQDIGALGGSIDLQTPRPLKLPDNTLAVSSKAFFNDLIEEASPEVAVLGSKRFADDRFGLAAGITYSDRDTRQDSMESGGWNPVGDFFPTGDPEIDELFVWENGKPALFEDTRERTTALLVGEADLGSAGHYQVDLMYSDFELESKRFQLLRRMKDGDSIDVLSHEEGRVTEANISNSVAGLNHRLFVEDTESLFTSARADWELSDRWEVDAQVGWLQIENDWPVSEVYKFRTNGFDVGVDTTDPFDPQFSYNNFPGGFDQILDSPELWDEFDEVVLESRDSEDTTVRLELNSSYRLGATLIKSLQFGVQYQNREKDQVQSKVKDDSNTQPLTDFELGKSIPGDGSFLDGTQPWAGPLFASFDSLREIIQPENVPTPPDLLDSFDIEEEQVSGYLRVNFEEGNVSGNVGARIVSNDTTSDGYQSINGNLEPVTLGNDYVEVLPSGTLTIDLLEDFKVRFSGGKAMVKPQFDDQAPRRSVNEDELTVNQGNPNLDPFQAIQFDASLEWYFAEGEGVLALVGLFKDIDSFIFDQAVNQVVEDPTELGADASLAGQEFSINQPLNGEGATVSGFEIVWQQPFDNFLPNPLHGFGITTNYTKLSTDANFEANIVGEDQAAGEGLDSQAFGLPGISEEVINTTLYYQNHGLQIRVSYNFRDDFLLSPAGDEGQPLFETNYDQIDAFASYQVTPRLSVFFEGINLNDEIQKRFSGPGRKTELISQNGRRFFAGVRFKL